MQFWETLKEQISDYIISNTPVAIKAIMLNVALAVTAIIGVANRKENLSMWGKFCAVASSWLLGWVSYFLLKGATTLSESFIVGIVLLTALAGNEIMPNILGGKWLSHIPILKYFRKKEADDEMDGI